MSHSDEKSVESIVQASISTLLSDGGSSDKEQAAAAKIADAASRHFLQRAFGLEETNSDRFDAGEFAELMDHLRTGSITAVWQIIERYEPHIRRVVSRRLDSRMRSRFDTMDFVQMVWKSFFEDPQQIAHFTSPAQLGGYLMKMAQNKVATEYRRAATQKDDNARTQSLQSEPSARPHDTPSQLAIARERWEQLLDGLSDNHQEIIRLRLEGRTFEEIGEQLAVDERTARRVLHRVTDRLTQVG